jgi:hypothetical protein
VIDYKLRRLLEKTSICCQVAGQMFLHYYPYLGLTCKIALAFLRSHAPCPQPPVTLNYFLKPFVPLGTSLLIFAMP